MVKDVIAVRQPPKLTPFDEQTFGNVSQMIKASLPYMSRHSARPMAIMARFMELQNTLRYFRHPEPIQACGIGTRRPTPEEMLGDLRKYCGGKEAKTIDSLLNLLRFGKLYEKFKDMENSPDVLQHTSPMNSDGTQTFTSNLHGGDPMQSSFNPEQLLKNINPELLKNFDMNKFGQLMEAVNSGNFQNFQAQPAPPNFSGQNQNSAQKNPAPQNQTSQNPPPSGFDEDRLKALLTPEQLKLYESLKRSMT